MSCNKLTKINNDMNNTKIKILKVTHDAHSFTTINYKGKTKFVLYER